MHQLALDLVRVRVRVRMSVRVRVRMSPPYALAPNLTKQASARTIRK